MKLIFLLLILLALCVQSFGDQDVPSVEKILISVDGHGNIEVLSEFCPKENSNPVPKFELSIA